MEGPNFSEYHFYAGTWDIDKSGGPKLLGDLDKFYPILGDLPKLKTKLEPFWVFSKPQI